MENSFPFPKLVELFLVALLVKINKFRDKEGFNRELLLPPSDPPGKTDPSSSTSEDENFETSEISEQIWPIRKDVKGCYSFSARKRFTLLMTARGSHDFHNNFFCFDLDFPSNIDIVNCRERSVEEEAGVSPKLRLWSLRAHPERFSVHLGTDYEGLLRAWANNVQILFSVTDHLARVLQTGSVDRGLREAAHRCAHQQWGWFSGCPFIKILKHITQAHKK